MELVADRLEAPVYDATATGTQASGGDPNDGSALTRSCPSSRHNAPRLSRSRPEAVVLRAAVRLADRGADLHDDERPTRRRLGVCYGPERILCWILRGGHPLAPDRVWATHNAEPGPAVRRLGLITHFDRFAERYQSEDIAQFARRAADLTFDRVAAFVEMRPALVVDGYRDARSQSHGTARRRRARSSSIEPAR